MAKFDDTISISVIQMLEFGISTAVPHLQCRISAPAPQHRSCCRRGKDRQGKVLGRVLESAGTLPREVLGSWRPYFVVEGLWEG